jgi:3-methyladenine DNA glycosylase AlkD
MMTINRMLFYKFIEDKNVHLANLHHQYLLAQIKDRAVNGTKHTLNDAYLGTTHFRYPIAAPQLRIIAKEWTKANKTLSSKEFADVLTSLIHGESSTEKILAGILLDYASKEQKDFPPKLFTNWLDHLEGWAEIDAVCTNKYSRTHLLIQWKLWEPLLIKFSKSKNLNKKRASLVFLCSPVREHDDFRLSSLAFQTIALLQSHKEVIITKAISWLLRSMIKHYKPLTVKFVTANRDKLPAIAVRETLTMLESGTKTKSKKTNAH